jgi:hypothetical protein
VDLDRDQTEWLFAKSEAAGVTAINYLRRVIDLSRTTEQAPRSTSDLGSLLEKTANEVVQRTTHIRLWETDYAWWISAGLATALEQARVRHAHERILNSHGVDVKDLRNALEGSHLSKLFDRYLKPKLNTRTGLPRRQNEITTDIQVFAESIASIAPHTGGAYACLRPWPDMPRVEALVEIKVPMGTRWRSINYSRDIAKLIVMGEFYRRSGQDLPYLGAWILDVEDRQSAAEQAGQAAFLHRFHTMPGAANVRIMLFRPGKSPEVLQPGNSRSAA